MLSWHARVSHRAPGGAESRDPSGGELRRPAGGAALLAAVAVTGSLAGPSFAAHASTGLTLYSVATSEQFINNADDRQRGQTHSAFGNFHDTSATSRERGNGPFPGDQAIYEFAVYGNAALKQSVGTGMFTCEYNFAKHAFCNALYSVKGGTLIGSGQVNFDSYSFAIAIVGGTGKYRGLRGEMQATQGPNHSQRLVFG
jgi:hypothetical protein